jgi:hypothetical protein
MALVWEMDRTFQPKRNKYRAIKTMVGDICFDSKREAKRYTELLLLMRAGQIRNLTLQPEFSFKLNGKKLFTYRADFSYYEGSDFVVEDVKGIRTPVYKLKKKIVEETHGITIREV